MYIIRGQTSEQTTEVSKIDETQDIEQRQNDTSSYLIGDQIFNILVLSDDMDELIAYLESEGYYGDESVNGDSDRNTYLRKYIANRNSHSIYSVSICFFLDDIISVGIQVRKQTDDEPSYEKLSGIFEVMVGNTKLMDNGRSWEYRTSMITVMPIEDDEYRRENPNSKARLIDVIRGNCDYEIQLILPTILSETVPNRNGKRAALVGSEFKSSASTMNIGQYSLLIGEYVVGTHIPEGEYVVYPDDFGTIFVYSGGDLRICEILDADDNDVIGRLVLKNGDIIEISGTSMTFVKR